MNAHFNGYFNAAEIMEESVLLLDEQHQDNYNQQLDMFPFIATDNPSVVYEELDRAVEKVTIVTRKHPYSNWTDDCYVLAGQAQFIKRDYESAEKTFRYVVNEFRPAPKRARGKKGRAAAAEEAKRNPRGPQVKKSASQARKDRIRAREDATKERKRLAKQRDKERKARIKKRKKDAKARKKARKKGIKPAPKPEKDTTIVEEPEPKEITVDEGPVGMISIFNKSRDLGLTDEAYGAKPGSYLVKHRPSFQEGRLWLAWTLIKRDNFDQAQLILEDMRNDRGTFADIRRKGLAVQAFLYLESKRPELAIPFLKEAADAAKDRNERARYYYIAGQLHQQLNEPVDAFQAFEAVVKAKPQYDLEFGARLNMAQNDYLSGNGSAEDALRRLERMRKDDKNADYESQIYFSMANIALRMGDEPKGMEYLQLALASPTAQPTNRVEAYSLLGKLNFDRADYLPAKLYYDSTLTFMPKTDLRYAETVKRRDNLVEISEYIQSITLKDSLLTIANLSEAEQLELAKKKLQAEREAKRQAQAKKLEAQNNGGPTGPAFAGGNPTNSTFWAYDSRAVKRGQREFTRKFGERALEDNWRRSARADRSLFEAEGDAGVEVEEEISTIVTPEEAAKALQGIPKDDQAKEAMRLELQEAYFNLGRLYRNKLNDNQKTVTTLEQMHSRFSRTNKEAESWYYLYLAHTDLGNTADANTYKQQLIQKWGDTKYAKYLSDPNFINEFLGEEAQKERRYTEAYELFDAGQYQAAYDKSQKELGQLLGQHPLKPKYGLLMAMASGNLQGKKAYIAALRQVISKYDGTPEQTRAKEILRLLGEGGAALPGGRRIESNFKKSATELHYMIVVFDSKDVDLNQAKITVSDYNAKFYKQARLRITNVYLGRDNSTPVLVMRRFKNSVDAMEYFETSKKNKDEFLSRTRVDYQIFPVSQSNYREILKARSVEGYQAFFEANY